MALMLYLVIDGYHASRLIQCDPQESMHFLHFAISQKISPTIGICRTTLHRLGVANLREPVSAEVAEWQLAFTHQAAVLIAVWLFAS